LLEAVRGVAAIGFFNIWNFLCYYVSAANQPREAKKKRAANQIA
jgi:hypothetical protein